MTFTASAMFSQNFDFGKVSKQELEEKIYLKDSTVEAAYLYKYRRTYFDYTPDNGFLLINEVHERIKIYTKEGFDYATKEIRYYYPESGYKDKITGIKAYSYNLEGGKIKKTKLGKKDIFETQVSKNFKMKKITMPNVKEGTVIEIKYKKTSDYFLDVEDLQFQYSIPINKLEYSIAIPEYFKFNQTAKGYYSIIPEKRKSRKTTTFTSRSRTGSTVLHSSSTTSKLEYNVDIADYKAQNVPALKDDEPYTSNMNNYRGGIAYELTSIQYPNSIPKFYSSSWGKVANQIYKSQAFGGELNKSGYYKNDLEGILSSTSDNFQKVGAIYQFVKTKVKWNGYIGIYSDLGVRKAYKDGVGNSADINLMLISMLRSAGLDANPVLVSTRSNGVPFFPTIKGFNYVVAIVNVGDGYVLLDATERYGEPNILPTRALNWNGRVVRKDGSSTWIPLTSSRPATKEHFISVKMDLDEAITEGMIRSKFANLSALNYRNSYNNIKEESLIAKVQEDYNIDIENFKVTNNFKLGKPVTRMIKFSSEDLIEEINGKIYISPMLFFTQSVNPFKAEERKFPVDFDSPWKNKFNITIALPEGYVIESIPEQLAIGMRDNMGVFKYQVKQSGNKISVSCITEFKQAKIAALYYQELKEFYKRMIEKQLEKIVLVKS